MIQQRGEQLPPDPRHTPPLNFQTLFQESLELILTHLSLLPLPSPVTDVSRLATSKKIATLPFEVSISAKYVIGKNDCNSIASRQLPHSSLHETNKQNDSVAQQEITTGAEDHQDLENPDHSTSPVLCRVMSSYSQVWNP